MRRQSLERTARADSLIMWLEDRREYPGYAVSRFTRLKGEIMNERQATEHESTLENRAAVRAAVEIILARRYFANGGHGFLDVTIQTDRQWDIVSLVAGLMTLEELPRYRAHRGARLFFDGEDHGCGGRFHIAQKLSPFDHRNEPCASTKCSPQLVEIGKLRGSLLPYLVAEDLSGTGGAAAYIGSENQCPHDNIDEYFGKCDDCGLTLTDSESEVL